MGLFNRKYLFQLRKLTRIVTLAIIVLVFPAAIMAGEELVFKQITGNESVLYRNTITPSGSGYTITLESPGEFNRCELNEDLSVRTWEIRRTIDDTDIFFERKNEKIYAEGTFEGSSFSKTYRINEAPWFQFHELSMDRFGVSSEKEIEFWTIDRRKMKIVRFRAEKLGEETVSAGGKVWQAIKVELSLTGLVGVLGWHSHFWLRSSDGRYLRLEAPGLTSSDPDSTVELIEENP